MRSVISTAFVCVSFAVIPVLNGMTQLGSGQLDITSTMMLEQDSNIFSNSNQQSDTILRVTPGLEWNSENTRLEVGVKTGLTVQQFAKNDDENSNDANASVEVGYSSGKTDLDAGLSYRESSVANETVNTRTESENVELDFEFRRVYSEKFSFGGTWRLKDQHYTKGGSDVYSNSILARLFYKYSDKIELDSGIQYVGTEAGSGGEDSNDYSFFVGADGQIWPKITGRVRTGWTRRGFSNSNQSLNGFNMSVSLSWEYSDKITHFMTLGKDFTTTPGQQTSNVLFGNWRSEYKLPRDFTAFCGVGYMNSENTNVIGSSIIQGKEDKTFSCQLGLKKKFNKHLNVDLSIRYSDTSSTIARAEYDRLVFALNGTVIY